MPGDYLSRLLHRSEIGWGLTNSMADVDEGRAEDLAVCVAAATGCRTRVGAPDPHGHEIVINATPLGMEPDDAMPVDARRLDSGSIVVDIINSPDATALCRAARARGCRTQSGRPMHEGQAVHALRFLGFDYLPEGKSVSDISLPY